MIFTDNKPHNDEILDANQQMNSTVCNPESLHLLDRTNPSAKQNSKIKISNEEVSLVFLLEKANCPILEEFFDEASLLRL